MLTLFAPDPWWVTALAIVDGLVILASALMLLTEACHALGFSGIRLRWPRRRSPVIPFDETRRRQLLDGLASYPRKQVR